MPFEDSEDIAAQREETQPQKELSDYEAFRQDVERFYAENKEYVQEANRQTYLNLLAGIEQFMPPGLSAREYVALHNLLDDPDPDVQKAVRERFISFGGRVADVLREDTKKGVEKPIRDMATSIVQHFQREAFEALWKMIDVSTETGEDIPLEAMFLALSKFGYPETDEDKITEILDDMALKVHSLFMKSAQHNELSLLLSLNQVFFEEMKFSGADDEVYHHPDNTYAYKMFKSKRGIPITLSVLYLLVAERADVPLVGVGMPAHFVMYHPELDVFIDAFNNGAFLSRDDCKRFIEGAGFAFDASMLEKSSNVAILLRMIRNLIFAYSKIDSEWEVERLHELSSAIIEAMNAGENDDEE